MPDYPHAERLDVDVRLEALAYVVERVQRAYGEEEAISLPNVATLVDAVAEAALLDDLPTAMVHGSRLLDEAEVAHLVMLLTVPELERFGDHAVRRWIRSGGSVTWVVEDAAEKAVEEYLDRGSAVGRARALGGVEAAS